MVILVLGGATAWRLMCECSTQTRTCLGWARVGGWGEVRVPMLGGWVGESNKKLRQNNRPTRYFLGFRGVSVTLIVGVTKKIVDTLIFWCKNPFLSKPFYSEKCLSKIDFWPRNKTNADF